MKIKKKVTQADVIPMSTKDTHRIKNHQRLFLHPTYHPKCASRRSMKELFNNTCKPILREILDTQKLMITCHRPTNLRDILNLSKVKTCKEKKVSHHLIKTLLENTITELNYEELRNKKIQQEKSSLS